MPFTYDPTSFVGKDYIRFLLGDTVSTSPLLQDEEIAAMLTLQGTDVKAAAFLAQGLAAKFAAEGDISVDVLKVTNSTKAQHYQALSETLFSQAGGSPVPTAVFAGPSVGGISVSGKDAVADNTDNVQPAFARGQFRDSGNLG